MDQGICRLMSGDMSSGTRGADQGICRLMSGDMSSDVRGYVVCHFCGTDNSTGRDPPAVILWKYELLDRRRTVRTARAGGPGPRPNVGTVRTAWSGGPGPEVPGYCVRTAWSGGPGPEVPGYCVRTAWSGGPGPGPVLGPPVRNFGARCSCACPKFFGAFCPRVPEKFCGQTKVSPPRRYPGLYPFAHSLHRA